MYDFIKLSRSRHLLLATGIVLALFASIATGAKAQTSATVTVNTAQPLGTLAPTSFGVNTATWDTLMNDTALPPLLQALKVGALRYPGGSWSDNYHWQTNSGTTGSGITPVPADKFDNFMILANAVGASPIITCNYGSNQAGTGGGDPTEAAAWVDYANNQQHYGVKYWEIGNEIYGNGYYSTSADWETDLHDTDTTPADRIGNANLSPTAYGTNVNTYVTDMKAMDPTIKVGAVLALPNDGPNGNSVDWDTNVLAACGTNIDFVIVHWYPEYTSSSTSSNDNDANLLADPAGIAGWVAQLQSWINEYCGANAPNVQIFVTETNSDAGIPGKQMVGLVNALFAADDYMTWLENGAKNVNWWDLHNGPSTDGYNDVSLYGTATFGDEGILSIGTSPEPAAETPFAPYYGIQMLSNLGSPGDTMVTSTSNQALLATHAVVKQANGHLGLMLINKDPLNTTTVTVGLNGFVPSFTSTSYFYGQTSAAITSSSAATDTSFTVKVPPYSLTTLDMAPRTPFVTFNQGLQMIAAPATYTGSLSQYLIPSPTLAVWDPTSSQYVLSPNYPANGIVAGGGYWVRAATTTTLYDLGTHPDPTKPVYIPLSAGWNMIGDPFSSSIPLLTLQFSGPGGTVSFAEGANSGQLGGTLYTYPAGATAYQTETNALQPFLGYWIWSKTAGTLVVPAPE